MGKLTDPMILQHQMRLEVSYQSHAGGPPSTIAKIRTLEMDTKKIEVLNFKALSRDARKEAPNSNLINL
jgi:hypothetical protein